MPYGYGYPPPSCYAYPGPWGVPGYYGGNGAWLALFIILFVIVLLFGGWWYFNS